MGYDYKMCCKDIENLTADFPRCETGIIGKTVMKKPIYYVRAGRGEKRLFVNCAHHGLEYLTAAFIMRFLREYEFAVENKQMLFGYPAENLYEKVSVYCVPMVNPDGVDIAVNGLDVTNPYHQKLISMVGIHSFNKVWQANVRGVDINHNYNAGWRMVKTSPGATKYAGPFSESEPETKAIIEFVRKNNFDMLIAFHSQGGEIYYDFDGMQAEKSRSIAEKMAAKSGYAVSKPVGSASFGGCKDWFIKEFGRSGFTVEIGHGTNPLSCSVLPEIYEENARLLLAAMSELCAENDS